MAHRTVPLADPGTERSPRRGSLQNVQSTDQKLDKTREFTEIGDYEHT